LVIKHRVDHVRLLDAAHARVGGAVAGLQVVHVGVLSHLAGVFYQFGQDVFHELAGCRVQDAGDDDGAVFLVLLNLFRRQHG
jgi:hypothetical protein